LQYGVPLQFLVDKFAHMRFEPSGFSKNPQIPYAKSIVDYLFRWLASKFLDEQARLEVGVVASPKQVYPLSAATPASDAAEAERSNKPAPVFPATSFDLANGNGSGARQSFINQADAPPCPDCGCIMVRNGNCYKCLNCGTTSGCS
jgi:ribonucleoside-diphosphate reductase alpha chain